MITAIITAFIGLVATIAGVALKWWLGRPGRTAVEQVEKTDNAMLQRAVDRDTPGDTDDKLRRGRF